jgi:uncharacterized protein (DUF1800 family)
MTTATTPLTPTEASRFLAHAGLSVSETDIQYVIKNGKEAWINQQAFLTSSTSRVNWLYSQGYSNEVNKNNTAGIDNVIWHHLIAEKNQLVQRITLFWSEFFVVSVLGLPLPWAQFLGASYLDTLEKYALGNFRDLLKAVTLSPAMGEYLNLAGSLKASGNRHPDENYAREVMQLFTIGLEKLSLEAVSYGTPTYGQNDITGLAAAFTGWNFDGDKNSFNYATVPMKMTEANHQSSTSNSFLGTTISAGTTGTQSLEIILDTLFKHPNVGSFVSKRLILRLVSSNPSPSYISRVAMVFNNNGKGVKGDMLAVIKAVLLDPEANSFTGSYSSTTGRIREPMLRLVQWARTFNVATSTNLWGIGNTSSSSYSLGQSPLRAPSVFNYYDPTYVPSKIQLKDAAVVSPEMQITDEVSVAGYINFMQGVITNGVSDLKPDYSVQMDLAKKDAKAQPKDATQLVSNLNLLLTANQLSSSSITSISSAINAMSSKDDVAILNRVKAAIFLVMASPDYIVIR